MFWTPLPLLRRSNTVVAEVDLWMAAPLVLEPAAAASGEAWWRHDSLAARTDIAQRSMALAASETECG